MHPWHITWATESRHPMFPDEAARLAAVHKLVELARAELVLFCIVDEHVHLVILCDLSTARRRARAVTRALRRLAAVRVDPARIRPVNDRRHMENVLGYVLTQPDHHGLPIHSALWTGGCLPDLVGARFIPGLDLRITAALPRFRKSEALHKVGLPSRPLLPAAPGGPRQ